jgi:multidrug efflux pump subunit AcrA (membrane-fusion protein)
MFFVIRHKSVKESSMRSSSISTAAVVAIIGVLPLLAACATTRVGNRQAKAPSAGSARCFGETRSRRRELVGVVAPRYETDLGFRVAGKIVSRDVNVGDRVQIGDVVARLDPQDLKLQVESAEANSPRQLKSSGKPHRTSNAIPR